MPKRAFTDLGVERLAPPRRGRLELGDAIVRGLCLRVTPGGAKSWSVIYKVPGEGGYTDTGRPLKGGQHRITLGPWPLVGVARARERATEVLRSVLEGNDPRRTSGPVDTVASVVERMLELARREVSPASWRNMERVLRLHVVAHWGARPIHSITRQDINEHLDKMIVDGQIGSARETRKMLSRLMAHAEQRGLIIRNPMSNLRRRDPQPTTRGRALDVSEAREALQGARALGYPLGSVTELLLLTGCRKNEIARARWDWVDEGDRCLVIPASEYKSRREHVVALSDRAWNVLNSLPRLPGPYIFSTTGGTRPVDFGTKARARIGGDWSPHDLRRTVESQMARLGVAPEVRGRVLGHSQGVLQRAYNRHDYLEEKRAALALVAEAYEDGD